jgi:hypothetical protein
MGNYSHVREMPGFGPAAEILLVRQNDPNPLIPRPVISEWADANQGGRANSLCSNKASRRMKASYQGTGRQVSNNVRDRVIREFLW